MTRGNLADLRSKNGEITDPPVATKDTPNAPRYTRQSRSPSPPSQSSSVFCKKCLDNQHLFVSSLAQYLPEDLSDPEYAERERNYWRFHRGLERRYPQVCADCEPKVNEKLDQAAYTAKTDHLRRMLRHTAENRNLYTTSAANYFHTLGKWLWFISFFLQMLCYTLLIRQHFEAQFGHTNNFSWISLLSRALDIAFRRLPTPERLVSWAFRVGLLSCWWNPRWIECCKGRTKRLSGFPRFYACQVLSLALKSPHFLYDFLLVEDESHQPPTQVVSLAILAVLALYLYRASPNLIRTEHILLFQPKPVNNGGAPTSPPAEQPPPTRDGGQQTMADILDEILNESGAGSSFNPVLDSPTPSTKFSIIDLLEPTPQRKSYNPNTAFMSPNPFRKQQGHRGLQASTSQNFDLGGLSISDSPRPRTRQQTRQQTHYEMEMDWSPTQSQHRAFSSFQPGTARKLKFGETPVQDRPGVFWAKVPPAPITPAQRVFNPPNPPMIRASQASTTNSIRFQGANGGSAFSKPQAMAPPTTEFAEPKFLLKPKKDERDSLADMFTRSFSLDPEPEEDRQTDQPRQVQSFAHNLAYLVCGLCLAVVGNWAYSYWLSLSPTSIAPGPLKW